jgi:ribosomal protein L11 methyltransferase
MSSVFSQPKVIYKIHFITNYKSIEVLEKFFPEDIPGISTYEVESETIEARGCDLWSFEVYFTEKQDLQQLQKDLKIYAEENDVVIASEITEEFIEDKDWVAEYHKQLKPIEIGRFLISADRGIDFDDKLPIFIEASRAFGTGDHATTSLCIESMEHLGMEKIESVFDVGTGSGILSFAAEKIWKNSRILACDIEEVSVKIAKENAESNNSFVEFYQNSEDGLNIPESWKDKQFDLIVSNILAGPLISMAEDFRQMSHMNSKVILSGFLDYQQTDVKNAYEKAGFCLEKILTRDRWVAITLGVK